jgi:hypothetical protein
MESLTHVLLLLIPLMVLCLLAGLGLTIAVLVSEGRNGKAVMASQIVGLINLALILPLGMLAWTADTRDIRWMFMFATGAFALVGLMGLRMPRRYRD